MRPPNGGTPFNPNPKSKPKQQTSGPVTAGGLTQPPVLTYNPAIEAERRAAQRGLHDTEQDVASKEHFAETDLHQALGDIHLNTVRKRQDIGRSANRGLRTLGNQEADAQTKAARTGEDFTTRLQDIGRQFAQLGHRQRESANAAGVLDAGTTAAGAVARGQNQGLAEAPIHTAQQRLGEDLYTALGRIDVGRKDIGQDEQRATNRLTQDRNRDRLLTHRETGRSLLGDEREQERARREAAISNVDLITSEIYEARQNRPNTFTKTGTKKSNSR